ncbi:MAG: hypothetical protein HYY24_08665 [Verrucomicrobia bacterium]|nr:hypothetical protein [Verrucomicrobiota bacterium]
MIPKSRAIEGSLDQVAEALRPGSAGLETAGRALGPAEISPVRLFQKCVESIKETLGLLRV